MENVNVKDLLEQISHLPDEMPVMIKGHEGAWNYLTTIKTKKLIIDYFSGKIMGHHVSLNEIKAHGEIIDEVNLREVQNACFSYHKGMPPLTIGTFKKLLKTFPKEQQIMLEGFEGGWNYLGSVKQHTLMLNYFDDEKIGLHANVEIHFDDINKEDYTYVVGLCMYDHGSLP